MTSSGKKQENALNALEAAADALELPQIGEIIAERYRVIENLGKGAVGSVWGVEHITLGEKFAMKFLLPSVAKNPAWLERFREEARITSMLGHENIVFVTEFGIAEKYGPFLVMEYLEGENLADILEKRTEVSLQQILRFAISISSALSAVDELGIVHCDLTPTNLYLSRSNDQPTWKILDFGIANLVTDAVKTDSIFGSPRYMAPEQAAGLKLDGRADQFSLGVILYEMLTGQTPWKLNSWADSRPESRARYKVAAPSRISDRPESLEALDGPIMRAISIRRQDRYLTTDDFIADILEHFEVVLESRLDPVETHQPQVDFSDHIRDSLHFGFEAGAQESQPRIIVTFLSADSLRREYRRHLIAGRLYIAAKTDLQKGDSVGLDLIFGPKATRVKLSGTITDVDSEGFGIGIAPLFRTSLNQFLKDNRLGFGFLQQDVLLPKPRSLDATLSVGEAFLLTKIADGNHSLGSLRAHCSGLPFNFELCVSLLIERDFAQLSQGGLVVSSVILEESIALDDGLAQEITEIIPNLDENTQKLKVKFSAFDVERALTKSQHFVEKRNYLGAISVLESVTDLVPDASLHVALARLFDSFSGDQELADKHIALAAQLDSSSAELSPDSVEISLPKFPSFDDE